MFHGKIKTEKKLHVMNLSNGTCSICSTCEEDFDHLLFRCNDLYQIWNFAVNKIKLVAININITQSIKLFGWLGGDEHRGVVVNTIILSSLWEIWKRRCSKKFENKDIPISICLKRIKNSIKEHFSILKKKPALKRA